METTIRKLQQKYRKIRDEMGRWDELQTRILSQFGNASSIIERLQVLGEAKNYGMMRCLPDIKKELLGKQMETLEMIFYSMRETLKEFHAIVRSLGKIARDGSQLLKGGSTPTAQQMQLRVGIWPSLADCLGGLRSIHEMYQADSSDIAALRQLLMDQPNIPRDEVQSIFDIIFANEN